MNKAADSTNNIERIKYITTYLLATMNLSMHGMKPFNPILGETFQCKIGELMCYYEQTSHHPPVLNYYTKHPKFTSFGHMEVEIIVGANSMKAENKGKIYIQFND